MSPKVFLITPPFTQLNTPYPATMYLKGFLNTIGVSSFQCDLGLEVILKIFSREGIKSLFEKLEKSEDTLTKEWSENARRIVSLKENYIYTIDETISFLQGKNPTLAYRIAKRNFLPEASRFANAKDLSYSFGNMGTHSHAVHLATLYLEDIADMIKECIDPFFGFSRYAERIGRSANSFDELYTLLNSAPSFTDGFLISILKQYFQELSPSLVAISVPFPGNLYSAFRCAQWIKANFGEIKIVLGGGYVNTELRSLQDERVFEFFDFISLDDGERPLEQIVRIGENQISINELKRTFVLVDGKIKYINNTSIPDYGQKDVGTPDYGDLQLDNYISVIELLNPMHSLWSNGRWNKLTMAHGCYWAKCTFCDVSLNYIKDYEPLTAQLLCDRVETILKQTGETGFHFTDEAAPPSLMKEFALEILRRKLVISWWTNIRFEKSFTRDLCFLLKASGCIAVSGGLEVAGDRLLALINKGITVEQVINVNKNFCEAGIMVHAYLMYGFPTQTDRETIDSLEVVRQMIQNGILLSAYWHLFTLTAHSPIGLDPAAYKISIEDVSQSGFAINDKLHYDPTGADHEKYSEGLKKSLFNYMQGLCFDYPLQKWFDFKTPATKIPPDYVSKILENGQLMPLNFHQKVIWLGNEPAVEEFVKSKKGTQYEMLALTFHGLSEQIDMKLDREQGKWLVSILKKATFGTGHWVTLKQAKENYEEQGLLDFELFWDNKPVNGLFKMGLLVV